MCVHGIRIYSHLSLALILLHNNCYNYVHNNNNTTEIYTIIFFYLANAKKDFMCVSKSGF